MSKINGIIPERSFETVRNRIGEILADEISNQFNVLTQDLNLNAKVWVERFIPFGHAEIPAVNVCLNRGMYSGQTAVQADGTYNFHIDLYVKAKTDATDDGDKKAIFRLHRLGGVIQAILENPVYQTLGFQAPFVMSRHVKEFLIADPSGTIKEATSAVMGRLNFSVLVPESYQLKVPNLIAGYDTTVKLYETEEGYFYQKAA